MSHSLSENLFISLSNMGAIAILEDIFRASAGEYAINWEHVDARTDSALEHLYNIGFIAAKPISHAPYHFEPTTEARAYFELTYPRGVEREPRFAFCATLQFIWA